MCVALCMTFNTSANELCANDESSSIIATTPSSDFIDNNNGTVTHNTTGLIWQRCSLGQTWDGSTCIGSATNYHWQTALQQAAENDFLGLNDWRLPNINELASIVERRCWDPAINNQQFPNTGSRWYWSSSSVADFGASAWVVNFFEGNISDLSKTDSDNYVRLVRAGK
ncbi:MAG: DUF1566 domain-containing protein [Alkalimonas sp.]|nr:DUF1566 domain-containing protein [Alkalimonas sp.]